MKILINCISPFEHLQSTSFLIGLANDLANKSKEDQFCLLLSEKDALQTSSDNIEIATVKNPPSKALFFTIYKKRKLLRIVRNINADRVLCIYPILSKIKQEYFLATPLLQLYLSGKKHDAFKKLIHKFLKTENHLIVFSEKDKKLLAEDFQYSKNNISVIYPFKNISKTEISFEKKQSLKEQISNGSEFFMCPVLLSDNELILLLKGFSGFKKWQKSEMKLVVTARDESEQKAIEKVLENYRFKESVIIIFRENEKEFSELIASAYATIFTSKTSLEISYLLLSLTEKVPALVQQESVFSEIAGDAALYFNDTKEDITRQLLAVFKDEKSRASFVEIGFQRSQSYSHAQMVQSYLRLLKHNN